MVPAPKCGGDRRGNHQVLFLRYLAIGPLVARLFFRQNPVQLFEQGRQKRNVEGDQEQRGKNDTHAGDRDADAFLLQDVFDSVHIFLRDNVFDIDAGK